MENRANSAQVLATKAQEFDTSVKAKVDENPGSKILDYCNLETTNGANEYIFYRYTPGTVGAGEFNMYGTGYAGNTGNNEQFKTEIEYLYASEILSMADVNGTSLNLKSSFVESLVSAVNRAVDKKILTTLDAIEGDTNGTDKTKIKEIGTSTSGLIDIDNVDALIEACVYLSSIAPDGGDDEKSDVALYMTAKQYALLNTIDKIGEKYKGNMKDKKGHLFGCKVVKIDEGVKNASTKKDSIYIVPRGAIGAVSHENKVESKVWESPGYDSLMFKITRSLGISILEPGNIIRLVYTA